MCIFVYWAVLKLKLQVGVKTITTLWNCESSEWLNIPMNLEVPLSVVLCLCGVRVLGQQSKQGCPHLPPQPPPLAHLE